MGAHVYSYREIALLHSSFFISSIFSSGSAYLVPRLPMSMLILSAPPCVYILLPACLPMPMFFSVLVFLYAHVFLSFCFPIWPYFLSACLLMPMVSLCLSPYASVFLSAYLPMPMAFSVHLCLSMSLLPS